jgi:major type 1 subunit fimbrin (pilin)
MKTWIKRAIVAAGMATAMALPLSSVASDGTITFTGAVTANSCTINVNGSASNNATVALPIVDTAALTNASAPLTKAAGTFFNIALSACDASHADVASGGTAVPTLVAIYFEAGPNVDQATSGLINAGTSNVEVNLYKASGATVVGTQITPGRSTNQPANQAIGAAGTQWFYAGYSTAGAAAAATAGTVTTSVTYSLVYQ